jgi:hypothetical protein
MITVDYAELSTDELIQKFIDTAKITGSVFGMKSRLDKESLLQAALTLHAGHSEARVQQMQALGAELRRRKPAPKLRRLFEDDDPDVRGWAGPQFLSVDPDWATATITGLFSNLIRSSQYERRRGRIAWTSLPIRRSRLCKPSAVWILGTRPLKGLRCSVFGEWENINHCLNSKSVGLKASSTYDALHGCFQMERRAQRVVLLGSDIAPNRCRLDCRLRV